MKLLTLALWAKGRFGAEGADLPRNAFEDADLTSFFLMDALELSGAEPEG